MYIAYVIAYDKDNHINKNIHIYLITFTGNCEK